MNASTITTTTFQLRNAAGTLVTATVAYKATTRVATLTPGSALTGSPTTYTATVVGGASGVKDLAGNALASNQSWSFTTADTTAPTVTGVSPASGATGVSLTTIVTATFSEAMNAGTITTSTFTLRNAAGTLVTATVAYNATTRVATLTPTSTLTGGPTTYTATIAGGASGVKDAGGNALAANFTWSFTTVDTTPPTVASTSPANGATNVSVNGNVSVTFNEAMTASTITTSTIVLRESERNGCARDGDLCSQSENGNGQAEFGARQPHDIHSHRDRRRVRRQRCRRKRDDFELRLFVHDALVP
jgi:hypothetical protein